MAENTNIEWCDHTFNPWTGCTKVSPGCANCYAEGWSKRSGIVTWGKGQPRRRTSDANWRLPLKWNKLAGENEAFHYSEAPLHDDGDFPDYIRPRVFCASLADWLDDEVPIEWLVNLLETIHATPHLDWLLLTKRPENWRSRIDAAFQFGELITQRHIDFINWLGAWSQPPIYFAEAPANVWIGTTVEDQQRADERIPELLNIPAKVRFLSCEPLIGPVDLTAMKLESTNPLFLYWPLTGHHIAEGMTECFRNDVAQRIHWVICGGESGPKARPMHPDWARILRDQCKAVGVPFLFKQWGEWHPGARLDAPNSPVIMDRLGKKAAGRLLDGREWNEFPTLR